jgi:hypothetical protein
MFELQEVATVRVAKQNLKMSFSPVFPRLLLDLFVLVVLFPFVTKRELYSPLSATLLDPHANNSRFFLSVQGRDCVVNLKFRRKGTCVD